MKEVLRIAAAMVDDRLTGVTFSGGEPFEQPQALDELISGIRATFAGRNIDVLSYSGFPFARLQSEHGEILQKLDAVIAEPYVVGEPTEDPWVGSANQGVVTLSALGEQRFADVRPKRRSVQLVIGDGRFEIIGVPGKGDLARIERTLAESQITMKDVSWRP